MSSSSEHDQWRIEASLNEVLVDGRRYRLRPRTMDVLCYLAQRPNQVMTLEDLLRDVWAGVVVSESSVYRAISELRQVFAEAGLDGLIETIPKRGYRLASGPASGPASSVADVPAETLADYPASRPPARSASRHRRPQVWLVPLALLLVAAFFIAPKLVPGNGPLAEPITVGVLPFADLSPGGDHGYLAAGLSVLIRGEVGRISGIRVVTGSAMSQFTQPAESSESGGGLPTVDYVLEVSISRDREDLRWNVELIEAATGLLFWSRNYDSKFENLFEVQQEIALSIARAVGVRLGVARWSPYPGMTRNVDAFDEYLQSMRTEGTIDAERVQFIVEHLERAVRIDSRFGVAWVRLATLYSGVATGVFPSQVPVPVAQERARFAIRQAQDLNPDSPLVLEYLGLMATAEARWSEAGSYYEAARRAAEKYAAGQYANVFYAEFLIRVGRITEAIQELEKARNLNRLDWDVAIMLALAYGCAGDFDLALAERERARELQPSPRGSALQGGFVLIALGSRDPELIARFLGDIPDSPDGIDPMNINQWGKAYLDDPDGARVMLDRHAADLMAVSPIPLASWANFYGNPELGLKAYRNVPIEVQILLGVHLWVPLFEGMRGLPGFKALVQELGLADYWRESGHWSDFCHPIGASDFECA